ncbi:MAG: NupC/NupG family nucleoside CNT transporter [Ignavibacteriota bacterium]|nr:MAG: NupC/NupG family nucleoside CNT transporter [Chlorobiota bacterium]MBE7477217.1 NupC/NupG family nucleoside CNT transporter [Ignavibacteriales bacterium]MBL1122601.1 NupC/NupG family nucleoside CNT transporter [Ignavibacteriota bacterium]MEB2297025.1 NupC/NupG family nucleoside CNT transporter [Ignavibacteria bacterium]GJQ40691.1 MAG: nucleoside transporter NupC [Ignavibacteriaceae bacterium]
MDLISLFRGAIGILLLVGISFLLSNNKSRINWKLVSGGLTLQLVFAILILKGESLRQFFVPFAWPKDIFNWISYFFVLILNFTAEGAQFVFGDLAKPPGVEGNLGSFFAFQVLPTIIFFASLMSVLYYLGIMQLIVKGMTWIMARTLGTSGAETLSCAAEIFVGQTEAPLMIKPFLKDMTQSELLTIMIGGMATIAGGVMAAYIQILGSAYAVKHGIPLEQAQQIFATHLLGASVMAAPAGIVIAKIILPETGEPATKGNLKLDVEKNASNVIDAAANGAIDGWKLAINVGAMLIAFIALIALVNYLLVGLGDILNINHSLKVQFGQPLSFQLLIGLVFQFLAFGIGVPWEDALNFGSLLGVKIVLNEFVAYTEMGTLLEVGKLLNEKSILMLTYALCGFANFSSIAIQIGGTGQLAPSRKSDIAALGIKAVIGGTLATLMTATLAGLLFG